MLKRGVFRYGILAVALAFAVLTAGASAHAQETVQISVGQQKSIKVAGLQRVAIADPKVAEVSVLGKGDQVLIVGKSVGSTDLTLWTKAGEVHYTVDVAAKDPKQLLSELKQLLAGIEGITFRTVGAKVVIDGRILTLEDQERITKVVSLYGDQVVTFAKADKEMRNVVADQINKSLEASGIAGIKARSVGKSLLLEGAAPTPEAAKRAHQVALSIAPDVQNLVKIGAGKDMIVMDVNFVEIRSSDIKNFGIKWQDALSAAGTVTLKKDISGGGWVGNIGIVSGLANAIKIQQSKGTARILSNPKLVAQSGASAEFLAGGEIPIPLITAQSSTVQYKKYGIILNIKPILEDGNVASEITVEVSTLDPSVSVGGVPGFLSRRISTSISVRPGESVVLGGLIDQASSKDVDKVPGIGSIPIIGELFKSRGFQARESELLVFATPTLSSVDQDRQKIDEIKGKYQDKAKDIKIKILD